MLNPVIECCTVDMEPMESKKDHEHGRSHDKNIDRDGKQNPLPGFFYRRKFGLDKIIIDIMCPPT
jgi:hypothetical protein